MDATANSSANARTQAMPSRSISAAAIPIGTQLLEFTLTSVLGEGGFSIVYGAQDRRLHRVVAIKEYMPTAFANRNADCSVELRSERHRVVFEAGMHSFIDEARLLARFKHPALVDVLRFWEANGTAYMAMPLYEGHTLRQTLKEFRGHYDEHWLSGMIAPILDVLEMLHAQSIYHRDVAPDNIIIQPDGSPVLLDLGSARRVLGDAEHAPTVIVKPGYTPIEQYAETSATPQGPWTDIYALGALLHFAVTGNAPAASVSRVMKDTLVPLAGQTLEGYSERFLKTIDHALALQPKDRPQSISELRKLLGIDRRIHPLPLPTVSAKKPVQQNEAAGDDTKTLILTAEEMLDLTRLPAPHAQVDSTPTPDLFQAIPKQSTAPAQSSASELENLLASSIKASNAQVAVPAQTPPPVTPPTPTPANAKPASNSRWLWVSALSIGALIGALAVWKPWGTPDIANTPVPPSDISTHPPVEPSLPRSEPSAPVVTTVPNTASPLSTATEPAVSSPDYSPMRENGSIETATLGTPPLNGAEQSIHSPDVQPDHQYAPEEHHMLPPPSRPATVAQPVPAPHAEVANPTSRPQQAHSAAQRATTATAAAVVAPKATAAAATSQATRSTTAPAAGQSQTLTVAVSPWGEVWIDGRRRGITPPVFKVPLRPGSYQIEIRNPKFPTYRQKINISSSQPVTLQHSFQ